jgi:hypothetical protein
MSDDDSQHQTVNHSFLNYSFFFPRFLSSFRFPIFSYYSTTMS